MSTLACVIAATQNARRPRLTQPERSAATRQALLDSTIECLVELGYDRSTTGEISERAGLSRGAHLHHFQTRATLIVAAAQELARRIAADLEERTDRLPEGSKRSEPALDAVWDVFTGPLFQAVLELAIHARTDPELRTQFAPVEKVVRHRSARMLRRAFAQESSEQATDDAIALVLSTIRGLTILPILDPAYDPTKGWRFCRAALLVLLHEASDAKSSIAVALGRVGDA